MNKEKIPDFLKVKYRKRLCVLNEHLVESKTAKDHWSIIHRIQNERGIYQMLLQDLEELLK